MSDPAWRQRALLHLPADATLLLHAVEEAGELRLDRAPDLALDRRAITRARGILDRRLLVHSATVHTESGHHATLLGPWSRWVSADVARAAKRLALAEAQDTLQAACAGRANALQPPG